MSNQRDQIKQLEESNQELKRQIELQAKQIEALKSTPTQSDEERFGPYKGAGWYLEARGIFRGALQLGRDLYYAYPTEAQAEWEFKATQVRRKLQRICAVLGPAKDDRGYCITVPGRGVGYAFNVKFETSMDTVKAEQILGDDIKYLNWNSSPEAQDAREGKV